MNFLVLTAVVLCLGSGCAEIASAEALPMESSPLYGPIRPLQRGQTLSVFAKRAHTPDSQFVAVQTLQGITARTAGPKVWIDLGDPVFLDYLVSEHQVQVDRSFAEDFAGLISALKPFTSGQYVLYDLRHRPSLSAATTMAGLLDAPAADISLAEVFEKAGYRMGLDVRDKDCRWVYEQYKDRLNPEAIIIHTNTPRRHLSAAFLRDWGPALRALDWWDADEELSRKVYQGIAVCSPVYGWQSPTSSDEGVTIQQHSQAGFFQIPSDWMVNLSVHASLGPVMKDRRFIQKAERKSPARQEGVHTVTFILSDMDNILTEIGTHSFLTNRRFYRNPHRGQFPMGWGMAPSLVELSPGGVQMWYEQATEKDSFVGYCGLGYFYPSHFPAMEEHARRLRRYLERADLRTLLLIDRLEPARRLTEDYGRVIEPFAKIDCLRGFFYLEYMEYAHSEGRIFWAGDKPIVTARFDFRQEKFYPHVRSTPEELAAALNAMPRNPDSPDGYSFVTVHAWSRGLDEVYETIGRLEPGVRVVGPEEFIELVRMNLGPK
jgi:hypothetical protein